MEDASTAALLGRLVLSLVVVFGLMALAGRALKRRGLGPAMPGAGRAKVEVLARQGLGRGSAVALVRVAGKTLVLGVTDSRVTLLAEADPVMLEAEQQLALEAAPRTATAFDWSGLVDTVRERTTRRR